MRKLLLASALFLFIFTSPRNVSAGPLCDAQGGTCRPACLSGENTLGQLDCPSGSGPFGNYDCCIPSTPSNTPTPSDPQAGCTSGEINTAIGCIPVSNPDVFIGFILRWAIGIGGGIAFLLIIVAGFQIMTSSGNPERLKAGQELLTSAITGIILMIFSVFILELIGVKILNIPGLSTGP